MRQAVIAGNWKMNKTRAETKTYIQDLLRMLETSCRAEVILCPPYTALTAAVEAAKGTPVRIAAQNMHWAQEGAFTGEVSPAMLREVGVSHCILGHSERRQFFGETDESVQKKVRAALDHALIPIICVGETLAQREAGETFTVIEQQVRQAVLDVAESEADTLILAYEPVWAIGTGKTASAGDAQAVIGRIRQMLTAEVGAAAARIRIQYGGSVKADNIATLMAETDIDGALVGGASLEAEHFARLVKQGANH